MRKLLVALLLCLPLQAQLFTSDFESGSPTADSTLSASLSSAQACSGTQSYRIDANEGTISFLNHNSSTMGISFAMYHPNNPGSDQIATVRINNTAGSAQCRMNVTTSGQLTATSGTGTIDTSTETLTTGAWNFIRVYADSTTEVCEVYLNGAGPVASSNSGAINNLDDVILKDSNNTSGTHYDDLTINTTLPAEVSCGGAPSDNKYKSITIASLVPRFWWSR